MKYMPGPNRKSVSSLFYFSYKMKIDYKINDDIAATKRVVNCSDPQWVLDTTLDNHNIWNNKMNVFLKSPLVFIEKAPLYIYTKV